MSSLPAAVGNITSPLAGTGPPPSRTAPQASGPQTNGLVYCANFPLPPVEADLLSVAGLNPPGEGQINPNWGVVFRYETGLVATVTFTVAQPASGNSWITLQGDNGDAQWFDLSGCVTTIKNVGQSASFLIYAGPYGTPAVLQQTRQNGQQPAANFFNPTPAPGRFRFTGQGGSAASGSGGAVLATIRYRPLPLR